MKYKIDFENLRLSASAIQLFRENKYEFYKKITGRSTKEEKDYFITGGLIELVLFEPSIKESFHVLNINTKTKAGIFKASFYEQYSITKDYDTSINVAIERSEFAKQSDIDKAKKECDNIVELIKNGNYIVSQEDFTLIQKIEEFINELHDEGIECGIGGSLNNLTIKELLALRTNERYVVDFQVGFEFILEKTKNKLKFVGLKDLQIYDKVDDYYYIIDIKSTAKSSKFENVIYDYGYDIQGVGYCYEPSVRAHMMSGQASYNLLVVSKTGSCQTELFNITDKIKGSKDKFARLTTVIDEHISNPKLFLQQRQLEFKPWHK